MSNIVRVIGLERAYMIQQQYNYLKLFLKYSTPKKIINFARCEYELLMKKTRLKSKPYSAKIEPTNNCNLDCAFCNRKNVTYGYGSMSFEDFKKVFDQLKDNLFLCAPHFLGESLLHKDISKMIEYAHKNKVATYLSTNMGFMDNELADGLINAGLDLLAISFDGATQKTYAMSRKNGDFDKVIRNLKMFVECKKRLGKGPHVELQFIVFKHNEHEISKIKEIAKDIGVDSLRIRPGVLEENSSWLPTKECYRAREHVSRRKTKKTCWWLWRATTITWNGWVVPCCRKAFDKPFGNVFKQDFSAIWNNDAFIESRRCFSSREVKKAPCYDCEVPYGYIHG